MELNQIRNLTPGQTLWDDQIKGLHVRCSPLGLKVFSLYYRTKDGRQRRPKIGELGEINISEARRRAKLLVNQVAVGVDPKGEWNKKKGEATMDMLFERIWKEYWNTTRFIKSGWGREAKRVYEREISPKFGKRRLAEIDSDELRVWHDSYLSTPYQGNRALAVFSRMMSFAEEKKLKPQNTNPCALVKNHFEAKRERYASEEEIRTLLSLLEPYSVTHPHGVAFLYMLIYSGSRPLAIERAEWDQLKEFEIGGERYGILTFQGKSSAKTGRTEQVVFPPQAMKAINRLPRIEGRTITGIKMPRRLWREVKKKAGIEDLWARDWRRTFASLAVSNGMEMSLIGELLNHQSTETTKIYAKLFDSKRIGAVSAIAKKIEEISKAKTA